MWLLAYLVTAAIVIWPIAAILCANNDCMR